jgi:hypothetical protein
MSVSLVVIRVENEALGAVNDPLMSEAICAELDINVFAVTTSLAVTLIENEADGAVNDPDIPAAVNDLINVAFAPNEPDIPTELNTGLPSNVEVRLANELDVAVNDPLILDAIWAEPDNTPVGKEVK